MPPETQTPFSRNLLGAAGLGVIGLCVVFAIGNKYYNYVEGPIDSIEARISGASMSNPNAYALPHERVGIVLPDGLTAIAEVPMALNGKRGDLVKVDVYQRKLTKGLEYRVVATIERAASQSAEQK